MDETKDISMERTISAAGAYLSASGSGTKEFDSEFYLYGVEVHMTKALHFTI